MTIDDIANSKQKAIILMFGREEYDRLDLIELESGEKIYAWFFYADEIKTREDLMEFYSMDNIEILYCQAYNGASSF
jgi:hypothetical protein